MFEATVSAKSSIVLRQVSNMAPKGLARHKETSAPSRRTTPAEGQYYPDNLARQRGFARPGRTNNPQHIGRFDAKTDIPQDGAIAAWNDIAQAFH